MKQKIYKECPRCKGTGRSSDRMLATFTLGLSALFEACIPESKDICPRCGGKGYVLSHYVEKD